METGEAMHGYGAAIIVGVLLCAASVGAQEDDPKRPWAEGVSQENQAEALRLFAEGNRTFEESQLAQALSSYRKAIGFWDHPQIRFNMAVALIQLDQPLTAYENVLEALRWDGEALEPAIKQQALNYKKLLLGQLAQLRVGVSEQGAKLFLDGNLILVGPGEASRVLLPGPHQLAASKVGFLTSTRNVNLISGKTAVETLELLALTQLTRTERRWRWWKPATVLSSGAALVLAGIPLLLDGNAAIDRYDNSIAAGCPGGCRTQDLPSAVRDLPGRSSKETGFAVSLFAVGGGLVAAGLVMVIVNQPRVVHAERF
jgi:hypothetical protein